MASTTASAPMRLPNRAPNKTTNYLVMIVILKPQILNQSRYCFSAEWDIVGENLLKDIAKPKCQVGMAQQHSGKCSSVTCKLNSDLRVVPKVDFWDNQAIHKGFF